MFATYDDLTYDDDGNLEGFQVMGRERRLMEWREKKEQEEFERLCRRLRRKRSDANAPPEVKARRHAYQRRWEREHRKERQKRERERARLRYEQEPVVNTCEYCRTVFVPEFTERTKHKRFCSKACRTNACKRRQREARGLKRDMTIKQRVCDVLEEEPGLTLPGIAEQTGGNKKSLSRLLKRWVESGVLNRYKDGAFRYYVNKGPANE